DVFQFNFNGRSGKFFIGKNKQIIIGSLTKLNIQYSTAADSSISSFTVIEEDGAKYVFDQIESQSITAGFACGYNSKTYNTGWQLSKMVSPFVTDTIKFSYNTVYRSDYNVPYPQSLLIKVDGTVYRSFSPTGFIYTVSKKIGYVS